MPKKSKGDQPRTEELPSTLRHSPKEAQETFAKAHDTAAQTYGEGQRAHRTAYAALKHKFEKRGDRWVAKGQKGPSDRRSKDPQARRDSSPTAGGVDIKGSSKQELYEHAAALDVQGRSRMSKHQLAEAIARKQD